MIGGPPAQGIKIAVGLLLEYFDLPRRHVSTQFPPQGLFDDRGAAGGRPLAHEAVQLRNEIVGEPDGNLNGHGGTVPPWFAHWDACVMR